MLANFHVGHREKGRESLPGPSKLIRSVSDQPISANGGSNGDDGDDRY
jgi:hypothetical protein